MRLYGFPIFVLTTYKDDLFDHELFDSYLVFDFARYIAENEERVELNSKLIEQIKKHRAEMENWKEELESLLPRAGESATVDERILELDSKIERSIDGRAAISVPIKQGFVAEKINELISNDRMTIPGCHIVSLSSMKTTRNFITTIFSNATIRVTKFLSLTTC